MIDCGLAKLRDERGSEPTKKTIVGGKDKKKKKKKGGVHVTRRAE